MWCCEPYRIYCCEFIISQKWTELAYLKEHPQEGEMESTFNVYETI